MTVFGWIVVVILCQMTINSERAGRWLALGLLIGTLTFGTGRGL